MNDEQRDYPGLTELEYTVIMAALQKLFGMNGFNEESYELMERLNVKLKYFTYKDKS